MIATPDARLEWGIASVQGPHPENDDVGAGRVFDDYVFFIVCDGLGGHRGGALAAQSLVDSLLGALPASIGSDSEQAGATLAEQINAAAREHDLSYSRLIDGLKKAGVEVDRKILAQIAVDDPKTFGELVDKAKSAAA